MSDSATPTHENTPCPLPLILQLGFAGARFLADPVRHPDADQEAFAQAAQRGIADTLEWLRAALGPRGERLFFCGLSQIAIGGDMAFARALQAGGHLHRILLPQPLDVYLAAEGSKGPDFSPQEQAEARALLARPNVIHTRVVSEADDRRQRLREASVELARVSDVVICLVREGQAGSIGGSQELAELAKRRGRPVITLELRMGPDGQPEVTRPHLQAEKEAMAAMWAKQWLPHELDDMPAFPHVSTGQAPTAMQYVDHLKNAGSESANKGRARFEKAARWIVWGHVAATALAVITVVVHPGATPMLLALELGLLGWGLFLHHRMHQTHALRRWATARLLAEVSASLKAVRGLPLYLAHFFTLPFPATFRPLLRTLNALHLRDAPRPGQAENWREHRKGYLANRLTGEPGDAKSRAQIPYHTKTCREAERSSQRLNWVFYVASSLAILTTLVKLLAICGCLLGESPISGGGLSTLGALAIVLPTVAVAALSIAAAFDMEGKRRTSAELVEFLKDQAGQIQEAESESEYARLALETEARLLGENVNWHARRSFMGVA
jgi:hypothetical protein